MANKIRKGDQVVVLSGRDKGRKGAVLEVFPSGHVLVEGVNMAKRHTKPNPQANKQGGIIEKAMPLRSRRSRSGIRPRRRRTGSDSRRSPTGRRCASSSRMER